MEQKGPWADWPCSFPVQDGGVFCYSNSLFTCLSSMPGFHRWSSSLTNLVANKPQAIANGGEVTDIHPRMLYLPFRVVNLLRIFQDKAISHIPIDDGVAGYLGQRFQAKSDWTDRNCEVPIAANLNNAYMVRNVTFEAQGGSAQQDTVELFESLLASMEALRTALDEADPQLACPFSRAKVTQTCQECASGPQEANDGVGLGFTISVTDDGSSDLYSMLSHWSSGEDTRCCCACQRLTTHKYERSLPDVAPEMLAIVLERMETNDAVHLRRFPHVLDFPHGPRNSDGIIPQPTVKYELMCGTWYSGSGRAGHYEPFSRISQRVHAKMEECVDGSQWKTADGKVDSNMLAGQPRMLFYARVDSLDDPTKGVVRVGKLSIPLGRVIACHSRNPKVLRRSTNLSSVVDWSVYHLASGLPLPATPILANYETCRLEWEKAFIGWLRKTPSSIMSECFGHGDDARAAWEREHHPIDGCIAWVFSIREGDTKAGMRILKTRCTDNKPSTGSAIIPAGTTVSHSFSSKCDPTAESVEKHVTPTAIMPTMFSVILNPTFFWAAIIGAVTVGAFTFFADKWRKGHRHQSC